MGFFDKLRREKNKNAELPTDQPVQETGESEIRAKAATGKKGKRKTLPKDFDELVKAGDLDALKAVFDVCELTAYGGYGKECALHFYKLPGDMARWLVAQGLDVDTPGLVYGRTPLYEHATGGDELVDVLLELGADVHRADIYGNTPLHAASGFFQAKTVRTLIAHGADIHAENRGGIRLCMSCCPAADPAIFPRLPRLPKFY